MKYHPILFFFWTSSFTVTKTARIPESSRDATSWSAVSQTFVRAPANTASLAVFVEDIVMTQQEFFKYQKTAKAKTHWPSVLPLCCALDCAQAKWRAWMWAIWWIVATIILIMLTSNFGTAKSLPDWSPNQRTDMWFWIFISNIFWK